MIASPSPFGQPLELWAGPECTVNRVGDVWQDQSHLTGHHGRDDDLALIAGLGVTAIRYPVLWERVSPDAPDRHDWAWSDARLAEIARLGMRPIVGLLHHGSGPHYTSLVADDFVAMFARHAAAVAHRYPDVEDWTPINEPLTTARFSTLYGHWYPHARDKHSFWAAMLNQVEGTAAAMREIRRVNPAARLIQTEDLGETHATAEVQHVADYYNVRRWLTWDLLAGSVGPGHPLWEEAAALGHADRLARIADDPCPADVIGINHYPTSDRFLDHRSDRYGDLPASEGYHDIAAIRIVEPAPGGLPGVVRETWQRYGRPIAITESHLGCTREEQLRWVYQAWGHAQALRTEGVDIRAVTAWAVFGNMDWSCLLTARHGDYEPGVFDVRGGTPRETAIASLLRSLTGMSASPVPVIATQPGWWQRATRLEHPPFRRHEGARMGRSEPAAAPPLLIVGAPHPLAHALAGACELRGLNHLLVDSADMAGIVALVAQHAPWATIAVDAVTSGAATATALLASVIDACAAAGVHATIVADRADPGGPDQWPGALTVTTDTCFSPYDDRNLAIGIEHALRTRSPITLPDTDVITPTYTPDLARAVLDLVIDGATGTWHLTNGEALSSFAFGQRLAEALGLDPRRIAAAPRTLFPGQRAAAALPVAAMLPPLDRALTHHAAERHRHAATLARAPEPESEPEPERLEMPIRAVR